MAFIKVACNFCGSETYTILHTIRQSDDPRQPAAWRGSAEIPIVRCNQCKLVFLNPRYDDESLTAHYQDPQMFKKTIDPDGRDRSIIAERSIRVTRALDDVKSLSKICKRGRLLDVGCGLGFFLEALDNKYDAVGLEWSHSAIEIMREHPFKMVEHRFPDHPFSNGEFDIITFHNVLDHLPDPFLALQAAYDILKRGGLLMLTLINFDSFAANVYGSGFRLLGTNHLFYFTRATLKKYFERTGFKLIKIEYPYFSTDYAQPVEHARKILTDWWSLKVLRTKEARLSPPFYGSIMRVFATAE